MQRCEFGGDLRLASAHQGEQAWVVLRHRVAVRVGRTGVALEREEDRQRMGL